jgi:hypothetical protein
MNASRIVQRQRDVFVLVAFAVKTTNPNNGSQGFSRNASFGKARRRKAQRTAAQAHVLAAGPLPELPLLVSVTRVAPSDGLDPHDALGPALKGVIDGIADALGLKNDRDPRVTWALGQVRGPKGYYGVEIRICARPS